jgi:hypothetical protein
MNLLLLFFAVDDFVGAFGLAMTPCGASDPKAAEAAGAIDPTPTILNNKF